MNSRTIDKIIIKFIEDKISDNEIIVLKKWLNEEGSKKYFDDFIELNNLLNSKARFDFEKSIEESMQLIKKEKVSYFKPILKYAAIFITILGMSYFFLTKTEDTVVSEKIALDSKEVTLELDSGETLTLQNSENQKIVNKEGVQVSIQKGKKLDYQKKNKIRSKKLVYNTLKVPYGKTFDVVLSDGTRVIVNAGTILRYPVEFIENTNRLVYVKGEAYFEVAKDTENPFIVNANELNILVTGTQFNVSNYEEDAAITTVLVEGAVRVYKESKDKKESLSKEIVPGELASLNKKNNKIKIRTVDTSLYTEWINGVLVFKHMKFSDMIVKLERKFNVEIQNNNVKLNQETFTARFEKATLKHVLETLNKSYQIEYVIKGRKIQIN